MSFTAVLLNVLAVFAPIACWALVTRVRVWIALYHSAAASLVILFIIGRFIRAAPRNQNHRISFFAVLWLSMTAVGGVIAGTVVVFHDVGFSTGALWGMGALASVGAVVLLLIFLDMGFDFADISLDQDPGKRTATNPPPYGATGTATFFTNADTAERAGS
ncbi:hypothetical protein FA95DRAFT_1610105 [Auriscalpium vulgare]|uniref:Uncharacterized protein n=1 Tax=Auriscalpium vulgare TaxID=40419 RepID=A0ACB8REB2_9AGAM|nr:hypothetical protein FA95DRAFT_1610105 [Auriscalpium vulgare]